MAGDVKGILLNAGKDLITSSMTGFSLFAPFKYEIGNAYGFDPNATDTTARGTIVHTGNALEVQSRRMSEDTARYTITIPESAGPFSIGNIVLYCTMWNATPIPMFSVVLPFLYEKAVSNSIVSNNVQYPTPGNRFIVNITIKHSVEATGVTVNIQTPTFSSLPFYADDTTYPPPGLNPWTTFVLHYDSRTNMPSLVTTRADGTQWGIPSWQNIRNPKFGVADGGQMGDGYAPTGLSYLWGQRYSTPPSSYRGKIGGSSYAFPAGNFIGNLGGSDY